jgi:predicted RNA-binding Zn-ribbon protein involved in translation (DUF1610 family)
MKETAPERAAPMTRRTSSLSVTGGEDITPYDRVMLALNAQGFGGTRPKCPACPPTKRRGFSIRAAKRDGAPTVLLHCHRGCTIDEILAVLGLDPADLFSGNGQPELFDGKKFAIVELEGWKALPSSTARNFGIAGACAQFVTAAHSHEHVRGSGRIVAYFLDAKHARIAREQCGLTPGAWRWFVSEWKKAGMAHRCPPSTGSVLTLLRHPGELCPNCGESVRRDKRRRKAGLTPGSSVSGELSTKALVTPNTPSSYESPKGERTLEEVTTKAVGEVLELRAAAATKPQKIRRVSRCRECGGEAGHEPDCRSRPLLAVARGYLGG